MIHVHVGDRLKNKCLPWLVASSDFCSLQEKLALLAASLAAATAAALTASTGSRLVTNSAAGQTELGPG